MSFLSSTSWNSWAPLDRLVLTTCLFSDPPKSLSDSPHLANQILVTQSVSMWFHFSVCCLVAKIQTELTLGTTSSAILLLGKVLIPPIKIYSHRLDLKLRKKRNGFCL